LRILVIYQYFLGEGDGGISRFNQFALCWVDKGQEVTVISGTMNRLTGKKIKKNTRFVYKEEVKPCLRVIWCYVSELYNRSFLGRFIGYMSFLLSSTFAVLFCTDKHDVVIASSPPLFVAITGYLVSRLRRTPLVLEVRDLWPKFAVDIGILRNSFLIRLAYWFEQYMYRKAHLITAVTPDIKDYLVLERKILEKKIFYIPGGADFDIMRKGPKHNWVREKHGWNDKFVVLYVGGHGKSHDLQQILEAAELLKHDQNILLVLIGDGMEKARLRRFAERKELSNVEFLDVVPKSKVSDFINGADICTATLLPVFTTAYPSKLFDYMACSKPIILTIDGAARRLVVDHAKAGVFVPPRDARAYKEAVHYLYENPRLVEELGANGYEYVMKHFNRQRIADKYLDVLRGVIDEKESHLCREL